MAVHDSLNYGGEISGITGDIVNNFLFWIATLFICTMTLVPFFILRRADYHFSENIVNNLRQRKYEHDYAKKVYVKKLEQMTKATRSIAKFKRLYKDTNIETDTYADKQMLEMVKVYKSNRNIKGNNENVNKKTTLVRSKSDSNLKRNNYLHIDDMNINKRRILVKDVNNILNDESFATSHNNSKSILSEHKNNNQVLTFNVNPSKFFEN
jgi:hypothetical protein